MKIQLFIIDEPIHIEDEVACKLWQKTIWAKEKGYRKHYQSGIMPIGVDDFFGAHFIVTEDKGDNVYESIAMTKSVRKSQSVKYNIPFAPEVMLKMKGYDNHPKVVEVLNSTDEVSYESSWTINPEYANKRELSFLLRNYITLYACNYFSEEKIPRWLTAGVTQFKIDKYFEWLGGTEVVPEFSLPIIDNHTVRMMYSDKAYFPPNEPLEIAKTLQNDWDNKIVFKPKTKTGEKNVKQVA